MNARETIVATATPPGRGGIAVLRISGPEVPRIATALIGTVPEPRRATYATFRDARGEAIDFGIALYFPAPHSFTGEPVLELHGHGSPVLQELLTGRVLQLGARRARPGEFSERAFLEDKLDLAQAEAIADVIQAGSAAAARAAMRSLKGEFSARVDAAEEALIDLRVFIEAAIDFPEEEIDFLSSEELAERLALVHERLDIVQRAACEGAVLRAGLTVVIAGRPNAGKSTLLNRLAGFEAAIVTDQPGTTRDVLREQLDLDGLPVTVLDTAGLRAGSGDAIEREGMRRAMQEMARADRVLFVIDGVDDPEGRAYAEEAPRLPAGVPVTLLVNKIDALPAGRRVCTGADLAAMPRLQVSALTGEGLDLLRAHLKEVAGVGEGAADAVSARARHLDALARARDYVERARAQLARRDGELAAEELRMAQQALGEITGEFTTDDLLGEIFGSFCIGK